MIEPPTESEMEDEGIGLVLARATELRLKISNCIHRATNPPLNGPSTIERLDGNDHLNSRPPTQVNDEDNEEEEEERLLSICDALESLEAQLTSLQVLQQQQQYEKEVALAEIENSRKMLIDKLKEYEGKELEVICEASTFVSETVDYSNDLLLPPYPSRPPFTMSLDKDYLSQIPSMHKSISHGLIVTDPEIEAEKSLSEEKQKHVKDGARGSRKGIRFFVTSAAKTIVSVVGVVSILSLSGFGSNIGKLGARINGVSILKGLENENRSSTKCPPGRILVIENGEARCLVKERVEVPFSAIAAKPDINYGCG